MGEMTAEKAGFRPDIEGLRAVAVALVVLGHAGVPGMAGGYVGVDVFFVISGFLITGQLLQSPGVPARMQLVAFYARRARRILPAASVVLVCTVLASYHWLGFLRGQAVAEDGRWTAVFAANLHFAAQGKDYLRSYVPPSPLQHYWSLGVEEQFYLAWPLLVLAAGMVLPRRELKTKLLVVLPPLIVASLAWSVVQTRSDPTWAYYSPFTRAWELGAGALLAAMPRRAPFRAPVRTVVGWAGLGAIIASSVAFSARTAFPGYAAVLPVGGALFLLAAGSDTRTGAARVLGWLPFRMLGCWSFSLYLWHWPLLTIAAARAGHPLSVAQNLQFVAAALILAAATYYLVENPLRFAKPLRSRQLPSIAAGAACAAVAFAVCQWQIQNHAPPRLPPQLQPAIAQAGAPPPLASATAAPDPAATLRALVEAAASIEQLPAAPQPDLQRAAGDFAWLPPFGQGCLVDADVRESPSCVFGDPEAPRTLVLLGDSHMAMWLGAFHDIGVRNHLRVVLLSKTACAPLSNEMYRSFGTGPQRFWGPYEECYPWLRTSLARTAELKPAAVVVSSCSGCDYIVDAKGNRLGPGAWAEGLQRTLEAIRESGAQPVVLGDIPRLPGMLDCLALHQRNVQACSESAAGALSSNYADADRFAAGNTESLYIDPVPWFCSALCTGVIGDFVPYTNDYHVTATYARYLTPLLENAILAALSPLASP